MPLFGVNIQEFQKMLQKVIEADEAAAAAARHRSVALSQFIEYATASRGRVMGSYLEDIVFEFYNN